MNVIQSLRFAISRLRPAVKAQPPGALYVNWPDKQIGVMDDKSSPEDLLAIRFFSADAYYKPGDLVVHDHEIYRARHSIIPKAFDIADWNSFVHTASPQQAIGPYDPTQDYYAGDIIVYDGELWKCRQDNGAGPFDILDWELYLANAADHHPVTTYDPNRSYIIGDLVIYQNDLYKAVQPSPPGPWIPSQWELYIGSASSSAIHLFDPSKSYAKDAFVIYNGRIYKAATQVYPGVWNASQWTAYVDSNLPSATIPDWSATDSYQAGAIVIHLNDLYKAKVAVTPGPWNAAQWELYLGTAASSAIHLFDASKSYNKDDFVIYNGRIYKALASVLPGQWNASQWTAYVDSTLPPPTIPDWSATSSYIAGVVVIYNNDLYKANTNVAPGPWDSRQWDLYIGSSASSAIHIFDPTKTYAKDDFVIYSGRIYKALGPVSAGPWNASQWTAYVDSNLPPATIPDFDPTASYATGTVVLYNNDIYKSKVAVSAGPWNAAQWDLYIGSSSSSAIHIFDATKSYKIDDFIVYSGRIYRALVAVSPGPWNPSQWVAYVDSNIPSTPIPNWSATDSYAAGTVVLYNGDLYKANAAVAPGPWTASQWTLYIGGAASSGIHTFNPSQAYNAGDLVVYQHHIYRAKAFIVPGPWNATQWAPYVDITIPPDALPSWSAANAYPVGTMVIYNGDLYKAIVNVSPGPWNASQWALYIASSASSGVHSFSATQAYKLGDLVVYNHYIYRANVAVSPGPWNAAQWSPYVDITIPPDALPAWSATATYAAGTVVIYNGDLYKSKVAVAAGPWNASQWELYLGTAASSGIHTFDPTKTYSVGNIVVYNHHIYKALTHILPGPWNATQWGPYVDVTIPPDAVPNFSTSSNYPAGTLVIYNGDLYKSKVAVSAGNWNPGQWALYLSDSASSAIHPFDPTKAYKANDYVVYDNEIWQAKVANGPGAWNITQWGLYLDPSEAHFAISVWSASVAYPINSIVLFTDQVLYRALRATGPGPFVIADWDKYIKDPPTVNIPLGIYKFDPAKFYNAGDLVFEAGEIYRARSHVPIGAFDPNQWDIYLHQSNNPATPHLYARTDRNLADLASVATARNNLGLGPWATHAAGVAVGEISGLGNSSTRNVGFNAGEVAPGDNTVARDGTYATGWWDIAAWPRRSDGTPIGFNWNGMPGQPSWVWGGDDGINMYVYNPRNFHVAAADRALDVTGTAGSLGYSIQDDIPFNGRGGPEVAATNDGAAMMSFHRPNSFAINFGLSKNNQLSVGGWSLGNEERPLTTHIISTGDPDNSQGFQGTLWLKV